MGRKPAVTAWSRRDFLRAATGTLAAGGLASLGVTACSSGGPDRSAASSGSSTGRTTAPAPSTTLAAPTATDWTRLAGALDGSLVRPGDARYDLDHRLFNPRFDALAPQAIALCTSAADVAACLRFVRAHGVTPAVRSGGHSFGGWSSGDGLVIDTSTMDRVSVHADGTASVGAGARLIDLYAALADAGRLVPGGSCPTVGIAGLTMGGGVGVVGRKYGLTCDQLTAAEVVLADGSRVVCDRRHHEDLLWALQGGGGGNFGVVTSFTFATRPAPRLAHASLEWPWAAAAEVVPAWLDWAPGAPDELWSNCLLLARYDKGPGVQPLLRVGAVWVGDTDGLAAQLDTLVRTVGRAPSGRSVRSAGYLDTMRYEGGCAHRSVAQCRLPSQGPEGQVEREGSVARSDYVAEPLPARAVATLVDGVERRQADPALAQGGVAFDAYGGAINRVAPDATAFVHRRELAGVLYSGSWRPGTGGPVVSDNQTWVDSVWKPLRRDVTGGAYQNYADPKLDDATWPRAYYGANLPRLQTIKQRYDPDDLFHFPQSIPLP